jgi:hypothetical protein
MMRPRLQIAGQNNNIKIAHRCENVKKVKYFGTTVTNQNLIEEENEFRQ